VILTDLTCCALPAIAKNKNAIAKNVFMSVKDNDYKFLKPSLCNSMHPAPPWLVVEVDIY